MPQDHGCSRERQWRQLGCKDVRNGPQGRGYCAECKSGVRGVPSSISRPGLAGTLGEANIVLVKTSRQSASVADFETPTDRKREGGK